MAAVGGDIDDGRRPRPYGAGRLEATVANACRHDRCELQAIRTPRRLQPIVAPRAVHLIGPDSRAEPLVAASTLQVAEIADTEVVVLRSLGAISACCRLDDALLRWEQMPISPVKTVVQPSLANDPGALLLPASIARRMSL